MLIHSTTLARVSLPLVAVALLALPSLGWSQQSLRAGAKGATTESPVTSSSVDADHQALDVYVRGGAGGGVSVSEDAAHTPSEAIVPIGCRRKDVAASSAGTDGDWATVDCDATGALRVTGGTGGTSVAEDAAHSSGENIVPIGCRRIDSAATSAGTSGDWATVDCDANGAVRVKTELPAAAALADNTSNPTVPGVAAFLMCYDGSTWDRCQGGLTDTDDGTIAGAQVPSLSVVIPYEYDGTNWTRPRGPNTVAHDAADTGNPIKIGAFAETSVSGATSVADGDRTNLKAGIDGVLLVRPHSNLEDRVSGTAGITDGSSTSIVAAQGVGLRFCATTIVISNSSATNVTVDIRDGTAGSVLMTIPAAANMGGGVISLQTPLCTTANTIFAADPSASASTVAVTAVGFKTAL